MTRQKNKAAGNGILRRVRKQRLKYIAILPSLFTLLNGICGFASIVFAARGSAVPTEYIGGDSHGPFAIMGQVSYLSMAGYMLFFAMLADMLDGRLARMSQSTSSFGGQLDSLCDMISFGVAPAFLMLKILEYKLAGFAEFGSAASSFLNRFVWLAAAAYISCAAIRLARFNVENEQDESAHMSFTGLPTPAAAGVVGSLTVFQQEALVEFYSDNNTVYMVCENIVIYALPLVVFGLAVLMVSRIRYSHLLNKYVKGRKPFGRLIRVLLFIGLVFWNLQAALVVIFCGFALSGFARWSYLKIVRSRLIVHREIKTAEAVE